MQNYIASFASRGNVAAVALGTRYLMTMNRHEIAMLRALMDYEGARNAPPASFPKLPDLPGGRYTDRRFFELEQNFLWRRAWVFAAHLDEVPELGCFKTWNIAGQPIVLVHSRSGAVNAFYNTCRHRGAPVVMEETGKRTLLTCKYHGWTYDDQGQLTARRNPEDFTDPDTSCRALKRVRCERFGKLIFVNFDEAAPPLAEWLGPLADELAEFQFERLRLVNRTVWELSCNWKVAMEANMEVYHVKSIHAKTVAPGLDDKRNVNTFYPGGHGRMVAPNRASIERPLRVDSQFDIATVGEISRTCTQSYNIFPNLVIPLAPTGFPSLTFWPNGIDRCRMEVWWFGVDWGTGPRPAEWEERLRLFDEVLQEDTQFGERIQRSLESAGLSGVPFSYQEARIYFWNQAADALIGVDKVPAELRVDSVIGPEWVHPNDPRRALVSVAEAAE